MEYTAYRIAEHRNNKISEERIWKPKYRKTRPLKMTLTIGKILFNFDILLIIKWGVSQVRVKADK